MSKLQLEQITDTAVWSGLLARSPQATRFLETEFLDLFGAPYRLYGVFRSGLCIMGLPVLDGAPLPWCYNQGPLFHDEIFKGGAAKTIQYEVELAEFAVTELAKVEPKFRLTLSPRLTDVRGYDWVHYHDPDKPRCQVLPRYTAMVDLTDQTHDSLRAAARSARRQEERYAQEREGLHRFTSQDAARIETLRGLYHSTFARQGVDVPPDEDALLAPYLTHFLTRDCGHILEVRTSEGDTVAAAFVFEDLDGIWHVPIVGTGDTRYGGTLLYFHILDTALAQGANAVDFDGANSPNRGYFKHSIGAHPVLYFEVRYDASRSPV